MIYNRETKETIAEKIYESQTMHFLYNTTLGGLCLLFLRLPVVSRIYGVFQKSDRSKSKINEFVKEYEIDINEYENGFQSFNDFIIRKHPHFEFDADAHHLIAPADSCLRAYIIQRGEMLSIKNKSYMLSGFLKNTNLAQEYEGGMILIFRLRVYDHHRFCFVDDGTVVSRKRIRGFLDSVNGAATGRFTLSSNYRELSILRTVHFDDVIFAEIGAMLVGRIVQTHNTEVFSKGEEKGYFEFGGSSIVLLLKKDVVQIDDDILMCSEKGMETRVGMGERIGVRHA